MQLEVLYVVEKQRIALKGNIILQIDGKEIDISVFKAGLEIFIDDIKSIEKIFVRDNVFITIENYTSWCRFNKIDAAAMYLGGYANRYQRDLLKKVYADNLYLSFKHFGDIDAGGFYIYNDLCRKTGIEFTTYKMSVNELQDKRYRKSLKALTENDKVRLQTLIVDVNFKDVIAYMLKNNVKLEQEIISFYDNTVNS